MGPETWSLFQELMTASSIHIPQCYAHWWSLPRLWFQPVWNFVSSGVPMGDHIHHSLGRQLHQSMRIGSAVVVKLGRFCPVIPEFLLLPYMGGTPSHCFMLARLWIWCQRTSIWTLDLCTLRSCRLEMLQLWTLVSSICPAEMCMPHRTVVEKKIQWHGFEEIHAIFPEVRHTFGQFVYCTQAPG